MSDYFDKITTSDINDDEIIIEDELSIKDKSFTEWFNRVTDATDENGNSKWELLFHINTNIRVKTSTSVIGLGKVVRVYNRFKRNIELATDGNCEIFFSIGEFIKEYKDYTNTLSKDIRDIINDAPIFDQLTDGPTQRMIIRNNDIEQLECRDIPMSVNISFVMNVPKNLNIRKMLILFETIRDYKVFVLKTIKSAVCRTAVYRQADTRENFHYWITVDGQTGIDEVMNIGHMFLLNRKNKNVPSVSTQNHERDEYYVVFNKIFRHTSADNTWNYKGFIRPAIEEFVNRS